MAAEVAVRDPLPGRVTVLRELRAVGAPEGMIPLADTWLVDLAAVMARGVGVSPRLELYPLGLDLVQALRISQAAAGVRPDTGVGADDLLARVHGTAVPYDGLSHLGGGAVWLGLSVSSL